MENIKNADIEKLKKYNCIVKYLNKTIDEGYFGNLDIESKLDSKIDKSKLVYEFDLNGKKAIFLGDDNKNIEELYKLFEGKEFDDIYNDAKLFNKAMNLANNLPLYNFDKNLFENKIKKDIKKYGVNFQKIYENLSLKESCK